METIKETEWADDSRNYSPYDVGPEHPGPEDIPDPDDDEDWDENEDTGNPDTDNDEDWDENEDSNEKIHIDHTNSPPIDPDFASRPTGRTHEPLGPGHEPGI
ncbi:hypothetical protein FW774_19785 [Pedobacter sp. BS3]|uniref:hypothetical protein n=1 Tax=Pedobacter sp. BS3 TaxID=2567937 RepID=UPI0011F09060|nr:hypothetical protein [Pedobacter sp. BS3]TZF80990.1 hypothetical protein FW774_19785 [Pedobacter sp. BS3]